VAGYGLDKYAAAYGGLGSLQQWVLASRVYWMSSNIKKQHWCNDDVV